MNETKDENLLAGSTSEVPAGTASSPVMKDGEEPPDMLLALLNNALTSMVDSQQAVILGSARLNGRVCALLAVYDAEPATANTLRAVGNA